MKENKFGQIGVDWAKLIEGYEMAFENESLKGAISDVLPGQLPAWKTIGDVYNRKIVNDFTLFHWVVRCLKTCCGERFMEGLEYNASETRDGCLFVMDDEEEFVFVNHVWFEKVCMVYEVNVGKEHELDWKQEFMSDFANGPGWGNNWRLPSAEVAKNLTWDLDQEVVKSISERIAEEKYRIMAKQLESMVGFDEKDLEKIVDEFDNIEVAEKGNEEWQWKLK